VSTALSHGHTEQATERLRAQLRIELLSAGDMRTTDWSRMVVTGPEAHRDALGRSRYGYWAMITVEDEGPGESPCTGGAARTPVR
jgi:hypothetical protein